MIIIGLDIGTTSICGVALELPKARLLHAITLPNHSFIGSVEEGQLVDEILVTVEKITQEMMRLYPDAAGIGITGQMHGILYTDGGGRAISPLYTWQNQKGLQKTTDGETIVERLSRLTGHHMSSGYGLVTHAALLDRGEVPEQAAFLCTIADYVAMHLANRTTAATEASNAASIGFFDVELGQFDEKALMLAGVDANYLPVVLPSTAMLGKTKDGVSVFNAIGDNQASVLGSLHNLRASLLLNMGTGGQLTVYSDRFVTVQGLDTRPFPGGGFLLVGASLAGGKSYAMLEGLFRSVVEAFVDTDEPVPPLYNKMEALLDREWPSTDRLKVQTQFFGTRQRSDQRGTMMNIGAGNLTPQHLILGFLEGMIEELYSYYALLPEDIRSGLQTMIGSGNGIRGNPHLKRLCEERFVMPVGFSAFKEEASVGAALHAAVALGAVEGYDRAGGLLSTKKE
jgi:sedoheptulokinase